MAKNKLTKIMIINKNNENISPFENGLLLPTKRGLLESTLIIYYVYIRFLFFEIFT